MRNKYNARSCICRQDHSHDSVGEANCCNMLALMLKAKEFEGYDTQKTFYFNVNGKRICGHRVDFLIDHHDGTQEVWEFKGFETAVWHIKKKLFEALYPEIPYRVVTRRDLI